MILLLLALIVAAFEAALLVVYFLIRYPWIILFILVWFVLAEAFGVWKWLWRVGII